MPVVRYSTSNGWQMTEAHLWVGDGLATMPQTETGNPQIGLFPYRSGDITGATSYTLTIPLSSLERERQLPDERRLRPGRDAPHRSVFGPSRERS